MDERPSEPSGVDGSAGRLRDGGAQDQRVKKTVDRIAAILRHHGQFNYSIESDLPR
jgi:hypothetical protein